MDTTDIEGIGKRNPRVDLDLLRKAQEEQRQIIAEPAKYDLEPPFSGRRFGRRAVDRTNRPASS